MNTMAAHMRVSICILLSVTAAALNCRYPVSADDPSFVTSFQFTPSAFDSFRQNTQARYTLKAPASVSLFVLMRDQSGKEYLVTKLFENVRETKGSHAHAWLGNTADGAFAPAGVYTGVLVVDGKRFEVAVQVFHW